MTKLVGQSRLVAISLAAVAAVVFLVPSMALAQEGDPQAGRGPGQEIAYVTVETVAPVRIQLPADYDASRRYTLVVGLHGHGGRGDTDPMDALRMGASTLGLDPLPGAGDPDPTDGVRRAALRLVAALPTLAAAYHRLGAGLEPIAPNPDLGHAANYLYMLTGTEPAPHRVRALDTYLNTAADHGMNASTFTARVIASTRSDVASAVVGALGALKGPLHGGAPGPALDMVFELRAQAGRSGTDLATATRERVRREVAAGERIMGFGHRIYRVRDPRADVLGSAAEALLREADAEASALYRDALTVEAAVLATLAELKPERRLATNVEFYTALLLNGLGLPTALFTPTFAVARVAGWTAHFLEQMAEDRLIRPRVAYAGASDRRWEPLETRRAAPGTAH